MIIAKYTDRGYKGRWEKVYKQGWRNLCRQFGLVKCPLFPNMKKIGQNIKANGPYIINPEMGKWEWRLNTQEP